MEIGSVSSTLDALFQGAPLTGGLADLSRQQAMQNAQLLMEMYALKMATELQEAAVLALIQSSMGIGQNVDIVA